jgi:hypothetical protein
LRKTVLREFCDENAVPTAPSEPSPGGNEIDLSESAIELLLEAAKDPNGRILRLDNMGASFVRTNNRQFIEQGNMRSVAQWRDAVTELELARLIEDESFEGQVYRVTNAGYGVADILGLKK